VYSFSAARLCFSCSVPTSHDVTVVKDVIAPISYEYKYLVYTHINLFEVLLNQPGIRLYLAFFGWFGSKRTSVKDPNQPENGKYNLISGWFNKNSKMISLCVHSCKSMQGFLSNGKKCDPVTVFILNCEPNWILFG